MLVSAVAGIDDGDRTHLRGILCGPLNVVAHHDDVGIVGYHQNGVFQRLTLGAAGHLGVGKANDTRSQTVGGCLKTQTGTGGRLEEQSGDNFPFQNLAVGVALKLLSHVNHIENLLASKIRYRYEIMLFHHKILG